MIDYFAANLWQLWALVVIVSLLLELTSGDFFIICFAIGALVTAVAALGLGFYGQLAVFAVVSVLSIFFIRPRLVKALHGKRRERLSNADALMGRIGRVSEAIERGGYGRVAIDGHANVKPGSRAAIDGDDWKAVSADGSYVPLGQNVRVVGRESIILTVEKA